MNIQAQSQKYGYLIAAGGTIIAFIGFFFLPYITVSSANAGSSSSSTTLSAIDAASISGFIWLEALLAAAILLLALLLAYSHNPFGMSQVAHDKQVRWGLYAIMGVGVLSLLFEFLFMTTLLGQLASSISSNAPGFSTSFLSRLSTSYNAGSWVFLVGILIAIGGAVYALRSNQPAYSAQGQLSSQYPPSTQYPQQSPYPPYQQDWHSQAQPPQGSWQPQPTQQAWQSPQPPTNYPPTQQAQPPYPPYPPSSPG